MTPKKIYIVEGLEKERVGLRRWDLCTYRIDNSFIPYILESEHNRLVEELKAELKKEIKNMSEIIKDLCRQTTNK